MKAEHPRPHRSSSPFSTSALSQRLGDRAEGLGTNGLDFFDGSLWVAAFHGNELYRLADGKKGGVRRLPRGQLDGLVHLPDGRPAVTSWIGNAVYVGGAKSFVPILRGMESPADLGYDSRRRRLLVPNSPLNQVTVHPFG